jgi:hypothetical protein
MLRIALREISVLQKPHEGRCEASAKIIIRYSHHKNQKTNKGFVNVIKKNITATN